MVVRVAMVENIPPSMLQNEVEFNRSKGLAWQNFKSEYN
jgi:hypothetical protein